METKVVELKVSKECYELANAIADFVIVAMKEVKDNAGWSVIDDLPAIGVALVTMLPAFNGVSLLSAEMKENPVNFAAAWAVAGAKIAEALVV